MVVEVEICERTDGNLLLKYMLKSCWLSIVNLNNSDIVAEKHNKVLCSSIDIFVTFESTIWC